MSQVSIGLVSCPDPTLSQGKGSGDYWVTSWLWWLSSIDLNKHWLHACMIYIIYKYIHVGPIALFYMNSWFTWHYFIGFSKLIFCVVIACSFPFFPLLHPDYLHYNTLRHSLAMNTIGYIIHTKPDSPHTWLHTTPTHTHATYHTHSRATTQGEIGPKGIKGAKGSKGMNVSTLQNIIQLYFTGGLGRSVTQLQYICAAFP